MFEKILQELKTKNSKFGLSQTILEVMATDLAKTVETEDKIADAVAGVEGQMKIYQSFSDQNRNLQNEITNLKKSEVKTDEKKEDEKKEGEDKKEGGDAEPAWMKKFTDTLETLTKKIEANDLEKVQQTNAQKLQSKLDELKVSKSYLDLLPQSPTERSFQNDEEIAAFATDLKAKSDAYEQSVANSALGSSVKPLFGEVAKEGDVSADVQAFIKTNYNNETNTKA